MPMQIRTAPAVWSEIGRMVALTVVFGLVCLICIEITRGSGRIASIWIANGLLTGLLLASPPRKWLRLYASGYVGNLIAALLQGDAIAVAISLAACNSLEVAVAAVPLRRYLGREGDLTTPGALLRFAGLGVLGAPAVGGAVASLVLQQANGAAPLTTFAIWYPADVLGMIIMTPLVLSMRPRHVREYRFDWRGQRFAVAMTVLLGTTLITFYQARYPLLFLVFPPMVLMVLWHGMVGAVLGTALITVIAITATLLNRGPLSLITTATLQEKILVLQMFVAVLCAMTLPMASLMAQRNRLEAQLAERERDLRAVTDNLPALVAAVDQDQRYTFVNAHIGKIFGIPPKSMIGKSMREVRGETVYAVMAPHVERALHGEPVTFEGCNEAGGQIYHYQSNYIPNIDADGKQNGFYAMTFDITARKEAEQRLDQLSRLDPLTGIFNRREFKERLQTAAANVRLAGLAVMYIDVDHFKSINDRHGHAVGDAVLIEVALRLKECARETDTVARIAGDEFVMLLNGLSAPEEALFVARKIVAALERPVLIGDQNLQVGASVGIACAFDTSKPEALMLAADRALYEAKAAGRNTFVLSSGQVSHEHA